MIALCYKCGLKKVSPVDICSSCKAAPKSDDDLVLAFMLTDRFLSKEKLIDTTKLLQSGQKISFPPDVRTAVLAALQTARTQQGNKTDQGISLRAVATIAAIVGALFLIFHPWLHFQWALFRDELNSYQVFIARFPISDYSDTAKKRICEIQEPEVWNEINGRSQIDALRSYIRVYPEGKHLDEAKIQIREIADRNWDTISNSISKAEILKFLDDYPETTKVTTAEKRIKEVADAVWKTILNTRSDVEVLKFLKDYPETTKRADAELRIQELHNDFEWVYEQDNLAHYQRFASRFSSHPKIRLIEKRIIDLEVKDIAAGEHGEMPNAQPIQIGGDSVEVEIENRTGYELTVRYSGPDSKKLILPVESTQIIIVPPGAYQVAASVSAGNVRNYYGQDMMQAGKYFSKFHIETSPGESSFSTPKNPTRRKRN